MIKVQRKEYLKSLSDIEIKKEYLDDAAFFADLKKKVEGRMTVGFIKAVRKYLAEIDEDAVEVHEDPFDNDSPLMPDGALSDSERIPLKTDIDSYFEEEVLKFVPDAWMDRERDKVGCDFPFTKLFYRYKPLRPADAILAELTALDKEMETELANLKNAE